MTSDRPGLRLLLSMCGAAVLSLGIALLLAASSWNAFSAYSLQELKAQETQTDAQVRAIRDQEINQLRIALGRRLPNNRRADLYFRLAEIYVEAYRTDFMLEGRVHEAKLEKGVKDPLIDRANSKEHLKGGIKACREIISTGIQYDKMDRVLYFLGYSYNELGQSKDGMQYFERITREYPQSDVARDTAITRARSITSSRRCPRAPPTPGPRSCTSSPGATTARGSRTRPSRP
jgi:hypothetical protein